MLTVLREAYEGSQRHHTPHLAAALSFYLAFSLAPLLVIAIALAGLVLGPRAATTDILGPLHDFFGPSGARFLTNLVTGLSKPASNILAAAVGVAALIFGASGAFTQLHDALNIVFDASQRPANFWRLIQVRTVSFGMVVLIGLLLLVVQILNAALAASVGLKAQAGIAHTQSASVNTVEALASLLLVSVLFAALFHFVPEVEIAWRDALVGGLLTGLLFMLGQVLLSIYVSHSAFSSIHGAAAAALIIMTWLYYSSQVVFFGAEFTRAYAAARGHPV